MSLLTPEPIQAINRAGGDGTITITKLLPPIHLGSACELFAKVILPPLTSIGIHEHIGNTETYFILTGKALYHDNGKDIECHAGATTFCDAGEKHGIKNISYTDNLEFIALILKK